MKKTPGIFIVFEGVDGAGKTTQAALLKQHLQTLGLDVVSTREPTAGKWGMKIRSIAQHGRANTTLEQETAYFIEDRKEHVRKIVQPALDRGAAVISDRYYHSNIAYQGALGADIKTLRRLNEKENNFPRPDIVFYLDISPKTGISRINRNRDGANKGYERADYLEKVKANFDTFTDNNIIRITATQKREKIAKIIREKVASII